VLADQVTTYGNFYVAQCNVYENATLIAAAPDMYEALVALFAECTMVNRYGGDAYNQPAADAAINAARAALTRAEGR